MTKNMPMDQDIPYLVQSLNLGLDKLTLTVTPHNMAMYANFVKSLKHEAMCDDTVTFAGSSAQAGYRVAVRLRIPNVPVDAYPLFQVAPYGKTAYFRLEFNPNRLGQSGIESMKMIIDTSTPHGWPLFMYLARASRIDVNIDVQGVPLHRFLLGTKYPRYTEIWTQQGELAGIEVQTVYLGQKAKSDAFYRVYRLPDGKVEMGCVAATRFESVDGISRPKMSEIHKYTLPFTKLIVRDALAPKPAGWHNGHWEMFIRFAADHGLTVAMQHLTVSERKQAKMALNAVPLADINFTTCWSQWPALIDKLGLQKPGFAGSFLPGYSSELIEDNSGGKIAA